MNSVSHKVNLPPCTSAEWGCSDYAAIIEFIVLLSVAWVLSDALVSLEASVTMTLGNRVLTLTAQRQLMTRMEGCERCKNTRGGRTCNRRPMLQPSLFFCSNSNEKRKRGLYKSGRIWFRSVRHTFRGISNVKKWTKLSKQVCRAILIQWPQGLWLQKWGTVTKTGLCLLNTACIMINIYPNNLPLFRIKASVGGLTLTVFICDGYEQKLQYLIVNPKNAGHWSSFLNHKEYPSSSSKEPLALLQRRTDFLLVWHLHDVAAADTAQWKHEPFYPNQTVPHWPDPRRTAQWRRVLSALCF